MKTFREIINGNNGQPLEISVNCGDNQTITAGCWTDDSEVLDWSATFSVSTSWGEIGRYDNLHGDLDGALDELNGKIVQAVGGKWCYNGADGTFEQI